MSARAQPCAGRRADAFELNVSADYTNDESEAAPSTLLYVGTLLPTNVAVDGLGTVAPGVAAAYTIGGVPLGTPTVRRSSAIRLSASQWADDTFSSSPYISYENYQITAPLDGTSPYAGAATPARSTPGASTPTPTTRSTTISA